MAYIRAVLEDDWHLATGARMDCTLLFVFGGMFPAAVFCFFGVGAWCSHYRSSGVYGFCGAIRLT